jgi:RNA polymerase sigma-70 factor (ECF subfamily)
MSEMVLELQEVREDLLGSLIRRINERLITRTSFAKGTHDDEAKLKEYDKSDKKPGDGPASEGEYDHLGRASQILSLHGNSILRMAYSYLHNMSDAEDILQETLIQYIRTKPALSGEVHEKAWLLRVAANLSKNKIKYNKLRETDELMEELVADQEEDLSFVWEAVKALPAKYSEVIHLFYQEGMTTKEIAEVLERKEATVRSDLLRGREKLKEILKEAYDFE